jgi:hypothetical protein
MRPARILKIYCATCFLIGVVSCVFLGVLVHEAQLGFKGAAVLTLCINVLLLMILPLVIDWSERKYFKARFVQLEELAETNPQLKALLDERCRRLALPGLRLAAVDTQGSELLIYGVWRQNPRLVLPARWLTDASAEQNIIPSIELQLNRFVKRDLTFLFFAFCAVQVVLEYLIISHAWL